MDLNQIQKRISMIEKYAKEISDAKEMIKEELENDAAYVEAEVAMKEAVANRKKMKDDILNRGGNKKLLDEIKANNEEIALLKEILSAELVEVFKENDTDEISDADGETRKFKVTGKLSPRKSSSRGRDNYGKFLNDGAAAAE